MRWLRASTCRLATAWLWLISSLASEASCALLGPACASFLGRNAAPVECKRSSVCVCLSSQASDDPRSKHSKKDTHRSAASVERREEEVRRASRRNDVVIGKTSALADAEDYSINPGKTTEEYLQRANSVEREVHVQTERGMDQLKMLQLPSARKAFERVYELKPTTYLWQLGVVLYYLDDVHQAGVVFAQNAERYEKRFGMPASEERIWRHVCQLKLLAGLSKKDRKRFFNHDNQPQHQLPQLSSVLPTVTTTPKSPDGLPIRESRLVLRIAHELFDATVQSDITRRILARVQLRSLAGEQPANNDLSLSLQQRQRDPMQRKLSSWYYLGLYYDALDWTDKSKQCMKNALLLSNGGKSGDLVHCLPVLHMAQRDWFEDEKEEEKQEDEEEQFGNQDFEDENEMDEDWGHDNTAEEDDAAEPSFLQQQEDRNNSNNPTTQPPPIENENPNMNHNNYNKNLLSSPLVSDWIMEDVQLLTLAELRHEMKQFPGVKSSGTKLALQQRLWSLLCQRCQPLSSQQQQHQP